MNTASTHAIRRTPTRTERFQHWIAAALSVLLHVLLLLLLVYSEKPTVTTPQGASNGSRTRVDFVGQTREPAPPTKTPPSPPQPRRSQPAEPPPAGSRVQSTLVEQAEDPVPPAAEANLQAKPTPRRPRPVQPSAEPMPQTSPPIPQEASPPLQAQAPPTPPPPSTVRRPSHWGKPPGYIEEDAAPENAGLANSPAVDEGKGRDVSGSGPSMELGGYQVYYDVLSENRLRAMKDKGIKELYYPLPGTRYYMVCPLETALRRERGQCRSLDPYDPEMKTLADAREAVTIMRVYKQGELLWRGPGPYK